MAFWIKKKSEETAEIEKDQEGSGALRKKKDDKKQQVKRIDNLRIPQQLRIILRSLGTPTEYHFWTKDLSATGAFVLCLNFKHTPFQPQSTLLEAQVELTAPDTLEVIPMQFLAKIARVVEAKGEGANQISGFGLRIIQITLEQRTILESFIARHGSAEATIDMVSGTLISNIPDLMEESDSERESAESKLGEVSAAAS